MNPRLFCPRSAAVIALTLLAAPFLNAQTIHRPINDFLSTQGSTTTFFPPVPDYLGWTQPDRSCAIGYSRFALVDYAGLADQWLRRASNNTRSLGTTVEGTILESRLPDGKSIVTVMARTRNALTWVLDICDAFPGPHLFGHKAPDVLAGARPSLGDADFIVTYVSPRFRDPIPDMVEMFNSSNPPQEIISVYLWTHALGYLRPAFGVPDLTPGVCVVGQIGLFFLPGEDKYPVEFIRLNRTGR